MRTRHPLTEIAIADADRRTIACGIGALDCTVQTGIYHLKWGAGDVLDSRLVSLVAGERLEKADLAVDLPAAAPVRGTSTTEPAHEAAAVEASERLNVGPGWSGLMIMLRSGPQDEPSVPISEALAGVSLARLNGDAEPLEWTIASDGRSAIATAALKHSAYRLRAPRSGLPSHLAQQLDQSLWLPRDYKTLVFVPVTAAGPRFADMSVHIVTGDGAFAPDAPEAMAVEQLIWTMRNGASPDLGAANKLLSVHPEPMGDLLTAHLEPRAHEARPRTPRRRSSDVSVSGCPSIPTPKPWPGSPTPEPTGHPTTPRRRGRCAARRCCARAMKARSGWTVRVTASSATARPPSTSAHGFSSKASGPRGIRARISSVPDPDVDMSAFQDPATRRVARHMKRATEREDTGLLTDETVTDDVVTDDRVTNVAYLTRLPAAAVARALTDIEATQPDQPAPQEPDDETHARRPTVGAARPPSTRRLSPSSGPWGDSLPSQPSSSRRPGCSR